MGALLFVFIDACNTMDLREHYDGMIAAIGEIVGFLRAYQDTIRQDEEVFMEQQLCEVCDDALTLKKETDLFVDWAPFREQMPNECFVLVLHAKSMHTFFQRAQQDYEDGQERHICTMVRKSIEHLRGMCANQRALLNIMADRAVDLLQPEDTVEYDEEPTQSEEEFIVPDSVPLQPLTGTLLPIDHGSAA